MTGTEPQTDSLWRALAHPTRRRIVSLLAEQPRTTRELTDHFAVSRYAIMKHLNVLEDADLIRIRREGRRRWNILNESYQDRAREAELPAGSLPSQVATASQAPPSITFEAFLQAAPARLYRALTDEIDAWWPHRTGAGTRIILEPRAGGRFYEALDTPSSELLLALIKAVAPERALHLWGPLGLAGEMIASSVQLAWEPVGSGTQVRVEHRFAGNVDNDQVRFYGAFWQQALDDHLPRHLLADAT